MSLPTANLVWHCPCIVLFYAEDGKVGGQSYQEYAVIKLNGECVGNDRFAQNKLSVKKNAAFPGWDAWKELHKRGMECSVRFIKTGRRVVVSTENLGVAIENTTLIYEDKGTVYAALSGDQVALTDIRLR